MVSRLGSWGGIGPQRPAPSPRLAPPSRRETWALPVPSRLCQGLRERRGEQKQILQSSKYCPRHDVSGPEREGLPPPSKNTNSLVLYENIYLFSLLNSGIYYLYMNGILIYVVCDLH